MLNNRRHCTSRSTDVKQTDDIVQVEALMLNKQTTLYN